MCRKEIIFLIFSITVALGYELGVTHKYKYDTSSIVDDQCQGLGGPQIVGQSLDMKIYLTSIWQNQDIPTEQLIKIEIQEPHLKVTKKGTDLKKHFSELEKLLIKPTFILYNKGSVLKLWEDSNENYVLRNIKRGIASLLQTQKKDQDDREISVSGDCQTIYEVKGEDIRKRRANCIYSKFDRSLTQPKGVRSAEVHHLLSTDCKLLNEKNYVISKCNGREYVKTFSNVWKNATICINAESTFLLEGVNKGHNVYTNKDAESVIGEIRKSSGDDLVEGELEAILVSQQSNPQVNLAEHLKKYKDSLSEKNLASLKSAKAFYKLLPFFQSASKEDISKLLEDKSFKSIKGQILDLIAATSKKSLLRATFEHFKDTADYNEMLERFLISLSLNPKPNELVLKEIKLFLENKKHHEKIHSTLISTLGTLLKTYSQRDIVNNKILEEYRTYLEGKLIKCSTEACTQSFLRCLKNTGSPNSIPLLLQYALKGGKPALEAVLGIRNMDIRLLSTEIQQKLLNVFLQVGSKQDRSTRSVAADILLDLHPDTKILREILGSLSDQSDPEFATFLVSKILQKISLNKELRSKIIKLLPENYISLSQKGSSSLFTKPMLQSVGINVTYGIQMEMLPGNLMKRSVFDVNFETPDVSNLLTVTMFAEGVGSLAGGSSEDNADPSAGMELTLLGSSLRPYIFFTGTSQLMGHAWSGTASTLTPALQGIYSFSDDERIIVLHNGLIVQAQLRGVLSTDLSAAIQISLWNQNSQSQVKNAAALLMRGAITVDSGFSIVQGAFQLSGQSAIDFSTNIVFSGSPFEMCLQMDHPDIVVKQDIHRSVSVPGTKFIQRRTKRGKRQIFGKSYALHDKNNEQCRELN